MALYLPLASNGALGFSLFVLCVVVGSLLGTFLGGLSFKKHPIVGALVGWILGVIAGYFLFWTIFWLTGCQPFNDGP
jgi:Na+/proline symporter